MIIYNRELNQSELEQVNKIAFECGILPDTARLLFYRNVDSVEKAKKFLSPNKSNFYNPLLLLNMPQAVSRILQAVENNENIFIFGDYDVDGICATTILYNALKELGITARFAIPEREEGYGLCVDKVKKAFDEEIIDLLITVDCGVSDKDKIETIKSWGVDVIVTDHHQIPEVLPDCLVINPQQKNQDYPFKCLCGAGVAYKLAYALIGNKADKMLDLTALATVADSMELIDENRDIVTEGLKIFNSSSIRLPFKYFLSDVSKTVYAQTLAYQVAPKINAGGRMGDAALSLSLFIEQDENKIFDIAVKLNEYNIRRQAECEIIYRQAKEIINREKLYNDRVIMLYNKEWTTGFIGIVAVWLVEDYGRPVIVFAGADGYLKGSARSVDVINIYQAISSGSDLLVGYGGHAQAAGVSVTEENFCAFRNRVCQFVSDNYGEVNVEKDIYAEWNIVGSFSTRFAKEINLLEPYGVGNKKPYFTINLQEVKSVPLKPNSPHYSIKTEYLELLDFNGSNDVFNLSLPIDKTVLFEPNYSVYKGRENVKGFIKNISVDFDSFVDARLYAFRNEIQKINDSNLLKCNLKNSQEKIDLEKGWATLYVVCDAENLPKDTKGLKVYYFKLPTKNSANCIVVSPTSLPDGYERAVYLDDGFAYLKGIDCYKYKDFAENKFIEILDVERSTFIGYYNTLVSMCEKQFFDSVKLSKKIYGDNERDRLQFILATEVFLELEFFIISDGKLVKNEGIKNQLDNSLIYKTICDRVSNGNN